MFIGIAFVAFYIFVSYNKYNTKKILYMKYELENTKIELEKCNDKYSPQFTNDDTMNIYTKLQENHVNLNLSTLKTPNLSEEGVADSAFSMRNSVKVYNGEKDSIYNYTFETYDDKIDITVELNGNDYSYMHHWQI